MQENKLTQSGTKVQIRRPGPARPGPKKIACPDGPEIPGWAEKGRADGPGRAASWRSARPGPAHGPMGRAAWAGPCHSVWRCFGAGVAECRLHALEAVRQSVRVAGRTATHVRRGVRARHGGGARVAVGTRRIGTVCYHVLGVPLEVPSKTRVITPVWLDSGLTRRCTPCVPNLEHTHSLTRDVGMD